jgi:hypothetical protein
MHTKINHLTALIIALLHLTHNALNSYTISQPGTYVVGQNIQESGTVVSITASNVLLDLNGFSVSGGTTGISIASGLSNISIINGKISTCSAGISVASGCSSISFNNLEIELCTSRGIEFIGTAISPIRQVFLNNITIERCLQNPGVGTSLLYCEYLTDSKIENSILQRSGNVVSFAVGVDITNCSNLIYQNINITGLQANSMQAIRITTSQNCYFDTCLIKSNTTTSGLFYGMQFVTSASNNTHILKNITVSDNQSASALIAFIFESSVSACLLLNCYAYNNRAPAINANVIGFSMENTRRCSLINCQAYYNSSNASGANFVAGFYLNGSTTGIQTSAFINNYAARNNASVDANSYGIRVIGTSVINTGNIYLSNIGALNGPTTPVIDNQITSTAGGGSVTGGVPSGSILDRTTSNLATATIYGNVRAII